VFGWPNNYRNSWGRAGQVGEGDWVDGGPLNTARVERLVDIRADLEPGVGDRVAIDRAHLTDIALCLWTLAFRPGRTRLVDARSAAG